MTPPDNEKTTRRQIMRAGLATVGATVGATIAISAHAQQKIAQAQVQYQATPKGDAQCSKCVNFEPPSSCKIVAGTIAPSGWCIAFAPKDQTNG